MTEVNPKVIVIAGPNGAGKSTAARRLLTGALDVGDFVNADVIAQGLSAFRPESVAMDAGRIMLQRLRFLAEKRRSFAFETTLAARSYAPWIRDLCRSGYEFDLVYCWIPSPDFAISRVALRVSRGGHNVPTETVQNRYYAGLRNFFGLYQPLATRWRCYNTSDVTGSKLIATGRGDGYERIYIKSAWEKILRGRKEAEERTGH